MKGLPFYNKTRPTLDGSARKKKLIIFHISLGGKIYFKKIRELSKDLEILILSIIKFITRKS